MCFQQIKLLDSNAERLAAWLSGFSVSIPTEYYSSHRILLFPPLMETPEKKDKKAGKFHRRGPTWHPRQKRQVMQRVPEASLWHSDMRIVFSVLNIISTELVNSTEATQQEILTLAS